MGLAGAGLADNSYIMKAFSMMNQVSSTSFSESV